MPEDTSSAIDKDLSKLVKLFDASVKSFFVENLRLKSSLLGNSINGNNNAIHINTIADEKDAQTQLLLFKQENESLKREIELMKKIIYLLENK